MYIVQKLTDTSERKCLPNPQTSYNELKPNYCSVASALNKAMYVFARISVKEILKLVIAI